MAKIEQEDLNHLNKMIRDGFAKEALDTMIVAGHTAEEIEEFYARINYYPNRETINYIFEYARKELPNERVL